MNLLSRQHLQAILAPVFILAIALCSINTFAQNGKNYWQSTASVKNKNAVISQNKLNLTRYKLYELDVNSLKTALANAPQRSADNAAMQNVIDFPDADGRIESYRVVETSNMEPELAASYPEIKSYIGKGIDDPTAIIYFSVSPLGLQTMLIRADNPAVFIEPYTTDLSTYVVYRKNDKGPLPGTFECRILTGINKTIDEGGTALRPNADDGLYRVYRLALSVTGEYTVFFGGTRALALAAMNATMTRVNGVCEIDCGIHMNLIANDTILIYTNASTDPYSPASTGAGGAWNQELQTNLTNTIGNAGYDIGHLFGATGGGGNAGCIACVCINPVGSNDLKKGSAFTSPADGLPFGDNFDIDYVIHEIGHQFGGNHTFTFSNEGTGKQMEPGSGSTIMGYAGITGATTDVQAHSDAYFHAISVEQITNYIKTTSCQVNTVTGNAIPTANAGLDYTIPIGTPFALTGSGTDANDAGLTYCWEEMNSGTSSTTLPSVTAVSGPAFRTFIQSSSPVHYFPRLSTIQSGATSWKWEAVPNVARTMNFRFTVRDNHAGGPANNSDDMVVTTNATAGPFFVSTPNTAVTWTGNTTQTVTWHVASTTASPISCANVKISLSTDGGNTFPTVILASTPNDSTENITTPNIATTQARIKVEAVGNIFFDMSNVNFTITASPTLTAITTSSLSFSNICAGTATSVTFTDNGVANAGNTFTAQLSDSGGSFVNPVSIGTLSSVNAGTISVTIPAGSIPGTKYRIRVVSSSPAVTGSDNGSNFSIFGVPAAAGTITGSASVCKSQSGVLYSVPAIANATGYTWALPSGGSITAGANTNSITVSYSVSAVSGNMTVFGFNAGCNGAVSPNFAVTVNQNVTGGTVSGTSPLCLNATATYSSNGTAGGSWSSINTAVATVNAGTGLVTAVGAGTTDITYTVNSGCGSPVSSIKNLTVSPNVTAGTVSGTSPLCIGATETYTSNGTSGGNWTSTNTTVATVNAATGLVTALNAGTTNITYAISSGCGSPVSSNKILTVSPNVTGGTVSGASPLCTGATATFSSNGTSGGSWTSTNTLVATVNAGTGLVTALSAGTTNITYAISSGCGSPVSSNKILTVSPNVTGGTVSGASPLCTGATATFSSNGTSGGSWSSTNSFVATVNAGSGLVTAVSAGTTNITYTVSSGCGSPVSSIKNLTVSPNVAAGTVSGTSPLCTGTTATFSSNGTPGGSWSSTNSLVATINAGTGLVTAINAGNTNITYTVSSGCGSPVSSISPLTVSPNVSAGTVSGASPLCIGVTATYSSNGTPGGTWISTNTLVANIDANSGLVTTMSAGSTNITYTVNSGCGSPLSSFKLLTVNPNVTAGIVSGSSPLCLNATATYNSNGTSGGSWSSTNAAVATVNAGTGLVTTMSAGTTNITYTVSSGCGSPVSSNKTLTVNPNVTGGTVSGTSPLCGGSTATFSSDGPPGGNWSSTNAAVALVDAGTGLVTALSAGTTNITYTVSSGCNSPASSTYTLTVSPDVTAGTLSGTTPLCIGATATYTSDGTTGGSWSSTNTAVATADAGTGLVTTMSAGTTNITYTINSGCGSPASSITKLTVDPFPDDAGTITGAATVCQGETGVNYSVPAISGATGYTWMLPTGASITAGTNTNTITVNYSSTALSGNITVTGTNACGSGAVSPGFAVTLNPLPGAGGTITGTAIVCKGQTGATYSVPTIPNATGYGWTLPSGASITNGANTNSIEVSYSPSAVSGNISVTGTNDCGNGTTSANFAVTVNNPPVISNFTPASGVVGSSVSINGTDFSTATSVKFNGVNASFVINNNNQVSATVPAGATTGLISVTNPCGTASSSTSFVVDSSTSITLNLKLFIEGFYRGNGVMVAIADPAGNPGICDTVTVDLHTADPPYEFVASVTGAIDTSGHGSFVFTSLPPGFYFIVVTHRNSVETWSKNAIYFDVPSVSYDFTSPF